MRIEKVKTIVIGGGQAGLATSYFLKQKGIEHIVLEKDRVGQTWRTKRWDSFTLVTPNEMLRLPGFEYTGSDPQGFMPRQRVTEYLEKYAISFNAPVICGVEVEALYPEENGFFRLETTDRQFEAEQVVVATGAFQVVKKAAFASQLPADIVQLTSEEYRNPQALAPEGSVLVVGSGQSGSQIAEELQDAGRKVYLAVGKAGRVPRRYRGKDINWWMKEMGQARPMPTPPPAARFEPNPHLSGTKGGHEINLRRLGQQGMVLVGHILGVEGDGKLLVADDLEENLLKADNNAVKFKIAADDLARQKGWDFPQGEINGDLMPGAGHPTEPILKLNLKEANVSTVIWATGYRLDFSWIKLSIFDEFGYPFHNRGVSTHPGLYFIGLPWLSWPASSLMVGVGVDAAYITEKISHYGRGDQISLIASANSNEPF